jgi:transposase InsO family protein
MDTLPKVKQTYLNKQNRIIDYTLMKQLHEQEGYDISFMCRELNISRSAYYKWLKHRPSKRQEENEKLMDIIKEVADSNNSLFGSWTMTYHIRNKYGLIYNHKRVYRLMCIHNIVSSYRRRSSYHYRRSTPETTAENLLNRDFNADHINEKWCTDITEIIQKTFTSHHRLYLSAIIDLYDNSIVYYEFSSSLTTDLVLRTLEGALAANPGAHPLIHTDRGCQYTSYAFKYLVKNKHLTHSMSRVGACLDNAPIERFWGTLKAETYYSHDYQTEEEFMQELESYFEYYNNERCQKRFGFRTPQEVRREAFESTNPKFYPIPFNKKLHDYKEMLKQTR